MKNKKILGTLSGIMTGICWSLSGVFAEFLFDSKGVQANWMIPIRLVAGGLILLLYMLFTNREELFAAVSCTGIYYDICLSPRKKTSK